MALSQKILYTNAGGNTTIRDNRIVIRRCIVKPTDDMPANTTVQCIKINAGETVIAAGIFVREATDDCKLDLGYAGGDEWGADLLTNTANVVVGTISNAAAVTTEVYKYFAAANVITINNDTGSNAAVANGEFEVFAHIMNHPEDDLPAQS